MAKIFDIFKGSSAKSRLVVLAAVIGGFVGVAYLASSYLGGGTQVTGANVANAPSSLQSVPGGQLSPEYYRALKQTNAETAKQSQIQGTSSVATLMNVTGQNTQPQANCTVLCGEADADTTDTVNGLLKSGKISQADATQLLEMAKNNVPVSEYEANLERLVKEGKITPEQARQLLAQYEKQHAKASIADSAQYMDNLIKSGQLPVAVANQLLDLQKKNVSPEEYANELQRLVKEGKISPEVAAQLLAQYSAKKAKEATQSAASDLQAMAASGQITPDVAAQLTKLQAQNVPVDQYADELNRLVAAGKMTPAAAAELLAKYKKQKGSLGPAATLNTMLDKAEQDTAGSIGDLVRQGKLPPDAAAQLLQLQKNHATPEEYANYLQQLVNEGKLNPEDAKKLLDNYTNSAGNVAAADAVTALVSQGKLPQDAADKLLQLQQAHVSPEEYSQYLDQLVKEGKLSPEDAKKLLDAYSGTNQATTDAVNSLLGQGKISPDTASKLLELQNKHVSPEEYSKYLDQLVKEGKITPEDAKKLLAAYTGTNQAAKDAVNDLLNSGKISPDTASKLMQLQNGHVSPQEYAKYLDQLVKEGKISPEDAKKLLDTYTSGVGLNQAAKDAVNDLLNSGKISPETASKLLELQNAHVSPQEYAKYLDQLVKDGKISPEDAKKLLDAYTSGGANQAAKAAVDALLSSGKIDADTADKLTQLQNAHVSPEEYANYLDQLVKAGKITPEDAKKLLDAYKSGGSKADRDELSALVSQGKLPQADANQLLKMQQANVTPAQYAQYLDKLVKEGKLTPEQAKKLLNQYTKLNGLRTTAATLQNAQANNVSAEDYQKLLNKAVEPGILSPDQAAQLLKEYQSYLNPPLPVGAAPGLEAGGNMTPEFAALQQRLAAQQTKESETPVTSIAAAPTEDLSAQFAAERAKEAAEALRRKQEHIQTLMTAMSGQAQQLVAAWQPPTMAHKQGQQDTDKVGSKKGGAAGSGGNNNNSDNASNTPTDKPPLIKAGTIYYAILTTAVDSDYPDTPVMATVVDGPFKGAHLIGKLSLANGMDKLSLNFNLMDKDGWPKSKSINAFAMDPDTARTVMASNVNHHYMLRYGTMFANSFLTGYSTGITQAGTSTTGIFGTSSVHPNLSPGNKIAVGLGQVGTAFSAAIGSYINTPTTVKINSGVGIGLLFVSDVT